MSAGLALVYFGNWFEVDEHGFNYYSTATGPDVDGPIYDTAEVTVAGETRYFYKERD